MRRETLDDNLEQLQLMLDEMSPLVAAAFHRASDALLHDRLRLAEQVVARDSIIDGHRAAIELLAVETMALHQPMATPLRAVVTALRCSQQLERMGDLARHVAEVVARSGDRPALPEQARPLFTDYGARVAAMGDKAVEVLRTRNVVLACELESDDDAVDAAHRSVFEMMFGSDWDAGVPAAVDVALLARFHERYADHCVHLAEHVVYAVTGTTPDQVSL
ncbi:MULTISPECIES: phosphate signaling complex protein PhoU [unclassified Pseudonocardia]|uniref:phosphate signaling complex protein PhoU n=1 Tax=unclassified Pseudonocardia TaxID=2619320 RepID=UPI0001FFED7B|nr:phosphate signaling complex protein PhoU [Pseudonocardia sp. Ae707_Ps1]OLM16139.1 Phosphate transport system regulatory protein PhoU [Pseudonocardia sp. Ae707_Ps1]